MLTTKQLIDLQEKIEKAKNEKARSEGALSSLIDQLKKDFGIENIEEAEIEKEKLIAKKETLEIMIQKEIKKLEEKLCSANIQL